MTIDGGLLILGVSPELSGLFSDCVDIWAPGVNILSLNAFGANTATATMTGTSMACPHVVGVVAGLKTRMNFANAQTYLFVRSIVISI